MKYVTFMWVSILVLITFISCQHGEEPQVPTQNPSHDQIISLNGGITEIIYELGLDSLIVGIDVTSTYPEDTQTKIQLGHAKSIQIEKLIALEADHLLALEGELKPELLEQATMAGKKVHLFAPPRSLGDTYAIIKDICKIFGKERDQDRMINRIKMDLQHIEPIIDRPRVLFIYARGTGNLMVAGEDTALNEMIHLSGGRNAVGGFTGFKPLNTESLLAANPDVLLLFDSGVESLEGISGLLQIPGMAQTQAGKNKQVFTMDGHLLAGMGPRIGLAATKLNDYLKSISSQKI